MKARSLPLPRPFIFQGSKEKDEEHNKLNIFYVINDKYFAERESRAEFKGDPESNVGEGL